MLLRLLLCLCLESPLRSVLDDWEGFSSELAVRLGSVLPV